MLLNCAKIMLESGCDIIYITLVWSGLLTRQAFERFTYPATNRVIQGIHDYGGLVLLFANR